MADGSDFDGVVAFQIKQHAVVAAAEAEADERAKWLPRSFAYNGPTSMIRPGSMDLRVSAHAGMSVSKSFMRFDFAQRIRMETFRPFMFCWYRIFRSFVSSTSQRPSINDRSSPFFLAP